MHFFQLNSGPDVCMYVGLCMYVCMYVCIYIYIYIYIYITYPLFLIGIVVCLSEWRFIPWRYLFIENCVVFRLKKAHVHAYLNIFEHMTNVIDANYSS